eukprot:scaffold120405_cov26-Tisochrysis_lutea.AAC.1
MGRGAANRDVGCAVGPRDQSRVKTLRSRFVTRRRGAKHLDGQEAQCEQPAIVGDCPHSSIQCLCGEPSFSSSDALPPLVEGGQAMIRACRAALYIRRWRPFPNV